MSRTACAALVVMAAGGLAGPVAGQSSAWYNRDIGVPTAMTTKTFDDGDHISLFVACDGEKHVFAGLFGVLSGSDPGGGAKPYAFRFDGDPESEFVAMVDRSGNGKAVVLSVRGIKALRLLYSFRGGNYDLAETGPPGGGWTSWTLRGAKAAIDRLPCRGGAR